MNGNSTEPKVRSKRRTDRPAPTDADFPLQPHGSGYRPKTIRGPLYYFGRWAERKK